jgi:hypothetical protein
MKNKILTIIAFLTITTLTIMAQQKTDDMDVKQTITNFAHAADEQNDKALELLLDDNFRLVLNQMFGNKGIAVVTKQDYLAKIKAKEFGGDKREVTILNLTLSGNNAGAQVIFKGSKFTIVTFLQLIKTSEGEWKIINDLPDIIKQ